VAPSWAGRSGRIIGAMDDAASLRELLTEWLRWWANDEDAPVKMPNALHVRTALALGWTEATVQDWLSVIRR
jgi:hypothetical protein